MLIFLLFVLLFYYLLECFFFHHSLQIIYTLSFVIVYLVYVIHSFIHSFIYSCICIVCSSQHHAPLSSLLPYSLLISDRHIFIICFVKFTYIFIVRYTPMRFIMFAILMSNRVSCYRYTVVTQLYDTP